MFRFEELSVWQKVVNVADNVYAVTRPLPVDERFGLPSQMRRAIVSVSSNIAEGMGERQPETSLTSSRSPTARSWQLSRGLLRDGPFLGA